jgi:hypothetical protein
MTGPIPGPGSGRYERCDGALLTTADLAESVPLHVGELEELAHLAGLIEDWLLFASDEVLAELTDFARSGGGHTTAATLTADLGTASARLARMTRAIRAGTRPLTTR